MECGLSVFEKNIVPGTSQCDVNGDFRLGSILEAMQDAANEHCRMLHLGRSVMAEKGLSWVVFKTDLQIDRYPCLDEPITIQTFTQKSIFKFFPRYYFVLDKTGTPICRAGSLWMLMNNATRSTISPKECGVFLPDEQGIEIPIKISTTSKTVDGKEILLKYKPVYSDIDINGHVNNIRYADWLCNTFGVKQMIEKEITFVSIDYSYEVPAEMDLQISMTKSDEEFLFVGTVENKKMFRIMGRLRQRKTDGGQQS